MFATMLSPTTMPKLKARSEAEQLVADIRAHVAAMETTFDPDIEKSFKSSIALSRSTGSHDHHPTIALVVTAMLALDRFRGFAAGLSDAMTDGAEVQPPALRAPRAPEHTTFQVARVVMGAGSGPNADRAIIERLQSMSAEADQHGYDAAWHAWERAAP